MGNCLVSPTPKSFSAAKANPHVKVGGESTAKQSSGRGTEMKTIHGFAKVANRSMEPKGVSESMVHFYELIGQVG